MSTTEPISQGLLLGMAWVNEHLDQFALAPNSMDKSAPYDIALMKPLSELALTISILKRSGIRLGFLDKVSEWAWEQTGEGKALLQMLMARNDFLPCCAYYAALHELGYHSTPLHTVLEYLGRSKTGERIPLQPWARLALDYNLWKLGIIDFSAAETTGLYVTAYPEPWVIPGEIAYAITHEVFYLTDFGSRRPESDVLIDYLSTWIPYWCSKFSTEGDFDLAGEFSMTWSCLAPAVQPELNPISCLLPQQQENGNITGPRGAGSFLYRNDDTAERRSFLGSYHTTLVFIMAAALYLKTGSPVTVADGQPHF